MQRGLEWDGRDNRCIDIRQFPVRMVREEMPAAGLAPLSQAPVGPVVLPDVGISLGNLHLVWRPQGERIDRPGRPFPAGTAVAVAHRSRFTGYRKFNRTAKTLSLVGLFIMGLSPSSRRAAGR
jgi:hypothetical protein